SATRSSWSVKRFSSSTRPPPSSTVPCRVHLGDAHGPNGRGDLAGRDWVRYSQRPAGAAGDGLGGVDGEKSFWLGGQASVDCQAARRAVHGEGLRLEGLENHGA